MALNVNTITLRIKRIHKRALLIRILLYIRMPLPLYPNMLCIYILFYIFCKWSFHILCFPKTFPLYLFMAIVTSIYQEQAYILDLQVTPFSGLVLCKIVLTSFIGYNICFFSIKIKCAPAQASQSYIIYGLKLQTKYMHLFRRLFSKVF